MEFKYALSILFSNMGFVLKILLWLALCIVLTAAIGAAILIPILKIIMQTTDVMVYVDCISKTVSQFMDGIISIRSLIDTVVTNFYGVLDAASTNVGASVGLAFSVIFLYFIYSFLSGMSYYPMEDIINKLMSSNLHFGFASNMALNFKNSCKYSAAKMIVAFPIDVTIFFIMFGLAYGLFGAIKVLPIPILLIVGVILCSLRSLLFSGWLPRMLFHPEEKVYTNFSRSFTFVKTNMAGFFKAYCITFTCVYLLCTAFTLPTMGLINLFLPAMYYFLLRTVELIGYYKVKGYSFYTDATTVIDTIEFGYRSRNQEKMDIGDLYGGANNKIDGDTNDDIENK